MPPVYRGSKTPPQAANKAASPARRNNPPIERKRLVPILCITHTSGNKICLHKETGETKKRDDERKGRERKTSE
jgi:hypothetical protein